MKLSRIVASTSAAALALFAANPALANENGAETAAATTSEGPALWKVADEDTTIYLFGTVHALPDDVEWHSGAIKEALDSSSVLVTEIDMTPEAMGTIQQTVQSLALYTDGTTVRSLMNEEQLATYEAALTSMGLPAGAFDPLEPWFAAINLTQVAMAKAGIDIANGTETVLEQTFGESKGREALETVEFQLGIFDSLPQDAQMKYLIDAAQEIDEVGPFLNNIIAEWAEGDVEGVAALLNEAFEADPELAEKLLYQRNNTWAEWIDTRLDSPGTVFMAVGAGHLAGEKSVQDYLAERGISTTRVQ